MEGKDLEIYNQCLFKTISLHALKSELNARNVYFSPSDTFLMLTLRMRKDILETLQIQHSVVASIENEIKAYEAIKKKSGSSYDCSFPGCPFRCIHHRKYLQHLDNVHHNSKSRVVCQFRHECNRDFPTVQMLKVHVKKDHERRESSVAIKQNQLVQEITTLKCGEKSCNFQSVSNLSALKKHLFTHTDKKEETRCIFCDYKTNTTGTLKSHLSRKHRIQTINLLSSKLVLSGNADETEEPQLEFSDENIIHEESVDDDISEDVEGADETEELFNPEDVFVKALAITINTWMNISGIAYSTVNLIVKEVFDSYERGVDFTKK